MKLQDFALQLSNDINDQVQRFTYTIKYGQWYYENVAYFEQYLNLRQEKLSTNEYA